MLIIFQMMGNFASQFTILNWHDKPNQKIKEKTEAPLKLLKVHTIIYFEHYSSNQKCR